MKLENVIETISGRIICCKDHLNQEVNYGFASDMMSDVLTLLEDDILLITGLSNIQAIRTAEMSDIKNVIIARDKRVTEDMINMAEEADIALIACPFSMYKISGILYNKGLKPVY